MESFFYPAKERNNFVLEMKRPYCRLPLAPSNANKLSSTYELRCILTTCIRRIADSQQQLFPSHVISSFPIQFLVVSSFQMSPMPQQVIAVNMKTILVRRKLVTKPWNTSAFYHAPQKGPIGCKLAMSYAKSQKLSYLISSFTDMRLTPNHTIISKETCGKFLAQHQKKDE